MQDLTLAGSSNEELNAKMKALSLERGESKMSHPANIDIVEKDSGSAPNAPSASGHEDLIEGHKVGR